RVPRLAKRWLAWTGQPALREAWHALREDWLTLGVVLFALSAAVSTCYSVSPLLSWRGDHFSWLGLRTVLAYVVLFFATRQVFRTTGDSLPLLVVVAVASFVVSGYALVQWAGCDPLVW